MKFFNWKVWLTGIALTALALTPSQALAIPVDMELSLVIDVSGSIDDAEYQLQTQGYIDAFNDAGIRDNIFSMTNNQVGAIAVNVIYFSNNAVEKIDWTLLSDDAQIDSFVTLLGNLNRTPPGANATDIADGIDLSVASFADLGAGNGFEGRRVMDVSSDGIQNTSCPQVPGNDCRMRLRSSRDAAGVAGIQVNGLAITTQFGNLDNYFTNNVITGAGSFVVASPNFASFGGAVLTKLGQETNPNPVPEPGTVILFGTGLAGLAAWRMRKAKQA